jgi:hypothetical protein
MAMMAMMRDGYRVFLLLMDSEVVEVQKKNGDR